MSPQPRRSRRRLSLLAAAAALAALVAGLAYGANLLRAPELQTVDARFQVRPARAAPKDVVLVAIDDVSFGELRRRFPFPRRLYARALDHLRGAGARAIGVDVQFTEPTDAADDDALVAAVRRAPGTVLATTEVDARGRSNVFGGDDVLRSIRARVGNTSLPSDRDGIYRRLPYSVDRLRTFAVVLAEQASGRAVGRAAFPADPVPIDFAGGPGTVPSIPFSRVVSGRFPPAAVRGKIVILGATSPSLQDVHPTSAARGEPMAGPEINANAVATVLAGFPLHETPGWVDLGLIAALALVVPLGSLRQRTLRPLILGGAIAVLFTVGVQVAFDRGWIVPFTYPLLALLLATAGTIVVDYLLETLERERVRDLFSRFVGEPVVDEVLAEADTRTCAWAASSACAP